jgi:hypothetical protein
MAPDPERRTHPGVMLVVVMLGSIAFWVLLYLLVMSAT